jgi:murein DD-endopeptidase MepM/ murein hydrolase activator NlpD
VVGGCDPKFARFANYVVLTHANGLETQYLHFSRVVVHEGEVVKAGELLGYSGSTGWACGSHLHFKVAQPLTPGWNNPSVHALLVGYGDPDRGVVIASPACPAPSGTILATAPLAPDAHAPAVGSSSPPQPPASPATAPSGKALSPPPEPIRESAEVP